MLVSLSSPNIHNPKNLSEYSSIALHYPQSTLWAGGTFLMTRPDAYPARNMNEESIYLGGIEELHRFQRNDRVAEFGSMVTLEAMLNAGKTTLPKILLENIKQIGGGIITDRSTIGGAICTKGITTSLTGTLVALDASVEIRFIKKKRIHSRWIPIVRFTEKNGRDTFLQDGMVSRVRIAFSDKNYSFFSSIGSFICESTEAVSLAFEASQDQEILINPRFAMTFPQFGVCSSMDIDNIFSSLRLPLDTEEYHSLENMLFTFIDSSFPGITPLQRTRAKGLIHRIVLEMNQRALTQPVSDLQ